MTLCTAYIRQVNDTEELVFATDSCLTGGEKWKHGIKLFELPRKDCLLCFAGSTIRACPLVLNLISSIHLDSYLQSPASKLDEVLLYLSDLFSGLVKKIISEIASENIHELRGGAKFLFGGWDWQKGHFRVWKLYYSQEVEGFIFDELTADTSKKRFYTFLGDPSPDIEDSAITAYKKLIYDEDRQDDPIDMEPLRILRDISLNNNVREVDGSLQIAKVYKSNRTEFFGIYWESSKGKPCFQGREYNEMNKPLVRYFNPDTFEIIESDLPTKLTNITEEIYQDNFEFVRECFDEESCFLKDNLSEKAKHELRLIFKDIAYRQFLQLQEQQEESINNEEV
ncbi:MAG: hypothetical protein LIP04_15870 [Tannerellaceae bacterium]|nr:hypothetical protein [Tannerellaceae bacterium]